jgi:hypothetical protein
MAAMFAQTQANRVLIAGQSRGVKDKVHLRRGLIALPEANFVVNGLNPDCALDHFVRA